MIEHVTKTYRELLEPAMHIISEEEADAYFAELVEYETAMFGKTNEEATKDMKINLGYYAGYYDSETMERVNRLFHTCHPFLGG